MVGGFLSEWDLATHERRSTPRCASQPRGNVGRGRGTVICQCCYLALRAIRLGTVPVELLELLEALAASDALTPDQREELREYASHLPRLQTPKGTKSCERC